MALLDRLKERVETDLSDAELQAILDEIAAEIVDRFGAEGEITVVLDTQRDLDGYRRFHKLDRRIDTGQTITITETVPANTSGAAYETTLAADDYRVLHDGRTIERLISGTNPAKHWGPLVTITYTPVSKQLQRDEVSIQVAQLEIQQRGLVSERVGDWQATSKDLVAERERLLGTLSPQRGLVLA